MSTPNPADLLPNPPRGPGQEGTGPGRARRGRYRLGQPGQHQARQAQAEQGHEQAGQGQAEQGQGRDKAGRAGTGTREAEGGNSVSVPAFWAKDRVRGGLWERSGRAPPVPSREGCPGHGGDRRTPCPHLALLSPSCKGDKASPLGASRSWERGASPPGPPRVSPAPLPLHPGTELRQRLKRAISQSPIKMRLGGIAFPPSL